MTISRSTFWILTLSGIAVALGIVVNPRLTTSRQIWEVVILVESLVAFALIAGLMIVQPRNQIVGTSPDDRAIPDNDEDRVSALSRLRLFALLALIFGLWLNLYQSRWRSPMIFADDFAYLRSAKDWPTAIANLFVPYNEHLVAPARIWTSIIVSCTNENYLRTFLAWSAIPLFFTCCTLLFFVVWKEWNSEAAAVIAVAFFAITTSFSEIITWYSATMWLFPLMFLLASLLLAAGRPTLSAGRMLCICLLSFVSPFAYSFGVLVGPITTVWLFTRHLPTTAGFGIGKKLLPLASSALSSLIVLIILNHWTDQPQYKESGGRGLLQSFDPMDGIPIAAKLAVDRFFLRLIGFDAPMTWTSSYAFVCGIVYVGLLAILYLLKDRRSTIPFLSLILFAYAISIPFRTWVGYWSLYHWNRYNLLPHLGLTLFTVEVWTQLQPYPKRTYLSGRQSLALAAFVLLLYLLQNLAGV